MIGIEERDRVVANMRAVAERVAAAKLQITIKAEKGRDTTLDPEVVRFYVRVNPARLVAECCGEIQRLRRSLAHIAETCVQDPDAAQFACRVLDGTAEPPLAKSLECPEDVPS